LYDQLAEKFTPACRNPELADSHAFLTSGSDVTGISVKSGMVEGLKRALARESSRFAIIMDGDVCAARVRVKFASGTSVLQENCACSETEVTV
jgi:hypothetical protein